MYEFSYEIGSDSIQSEYQHLHHADALRLLERGRLDLLERMGFPNGELIRQGLFLVITSINVQYLRELVAGAVTVQCHSLRTEGRDLIIEQRVLNSRGKRAVEATVTSCFMSGETRRAVLPPAAFLAVFI